MPERRDRAPDPGAGRRMGRRGEGAGALRARAGTPALLALFAALATWGAAGGPAWAACAVPNQLTNGQPADASQVMGDINAVVACINGGAASPLAMGFTLNNAAVGTNVGPMLIASRGGSFTKVKVVVKASDGATPLTFRIRQNGTDIFSSDPVLAAGTTSGTVLTFTTLTASPLPVAADDLFTIDVTSGSPFWQVTIQME
jgi:hypothetical protein